ncbi:MAG: hypothetical protein ACREQM_13310 [Candidatus Dormibacteraceae bacterium]
MNLIDLTGEDLPAGGTPARLRLNDAIRLAVGLRVGAGEIFTYDAELLSEPDVPTCPGEGVVPPPRTGDIAGR